MRPFALSVKLLMFAVQHLYTFLSKKRDCFGTPSCIILQKMEMLSTTVPLCSADKPAAPLFHHGSRDRKVDGHPSSQRGTKTTIVWETKVQKDDRTQD